MRGVLGGNPGEAARGPGSWGALSRSGTRPPGTGHGRGRTALRPWTPACLAPPWSWFPRPAVQGPPGEPGGWASPPPCSTPSTRPAPAGSSDLRAVPKPRVPPALPSRSNHAPAPAALAQLSSRPCSARGQACTSEATDTSLCNVGDGERSRAPTAPQPVCWGETRLFPWRHRPAGSGEGSCPPVTLGAGGTDADPVHQH